MLEGHVRARRYTASFASLGIVCGLLVALHTSGCASQVLGGTEVGRSGWKVTVVFPTVADVNARLIPTAAKSVVLTVVSKGEGTTLATAVLTPASPSTTINTLPVGLLCTITATAHPNADGSGTAQARASVDQTVPASVGALTLTMASTISSVTITPDPTTLPVDSTAALTAAARDASTNVVLVGGTWSWLSSDLTVATVSSSGVVTAVGVGSATITATETESGRFNTATVTVFYELPKETEIVFASTREKDESQLYILDALGTTTKVTAAPGQSYCPKWSPDGKLIAFSSSCGSGDEANRDIYTCTRDGGGLTRLTSGATDETQPCWSPTGAKIAYLVDGSGDGRYEVWTMDPDGSKATQITSLKAHCSAPCWSPDGTRIAFAFDKGGGDLGIYTVAVDGSDLTQLTTDPAQDDRPVWSPDGKHIAFQSDRATDPEVFLMEADGADQTQITKESSNWVDAWSTDGAQLLFTSDRDGNNELYVMESNGTHQTRVTNDKADDRDGDWHPKPDSSGWAITIK
jgi:Tol biopolymer transport system component